MLNALCLMVALAASAGPCTNASPDCTDWITFGSGPARSLIYRTYALDAKNEKITRALVMVHGAGRDADNYFRTALAATFLAGALENTIVIAPRFASNDGRSCRDVLAQDEVGWNCSGDSWRSGGAAPVNTQLTSYDFMDQILLKLARKEVFPNLKAIVLAGHSAGGQFATRYETSNTVHGTLGVPITYVVANPSSYAYLDDSRLAPDGTGFRAFNDARNCTTYDNWPYGLQNRTGYSARLSDDQLKKQIVARPAVYLVGELDTLPLAGFDSSCPAMAQGPSRLARGQAFVKFINEKYGAKHRLQVISLCGHNARCMFTAEPALSILFRKQ
jgi:hypothetical protein